MPTSAVKGGLFVAAAVVTGMVVGLVLPSLVVAERETGSSAHPQRKASLPTMPSLIGRTLDEAEDELGRRQISYSTDAPHLVEVLVPTVLEVCETEPPAGAKVRGNARVRAAVAGTCSI
jgi:hypothetical protein